MKSIENIQQIAVSSLIAYAGNPRKNDHAVEAVAAAIKRFGFRVPVLAKSDGSLIDGHLRVKAAKHLGMEEVPAVLCDDLSEADIKALRISINRMAELAEWDAELLNAELEGLAEEGFTLDDVGFDAAALEELNAGIELDEDRSEIDAEPQIDKAEELRAKWGVEPGQLWELGDHRLLCGDSTKKEDVDRVMGGEKADMVFTDPPYGMSLQANYHRANWGDRPNKHSKGNQGNAHKNVVGDHSDFRPELISAVFDRFSYCAEIFLWGADYYAELIPSRKDGSWIVWDKVTNAQGEESGCAAFHGSNFELCWSKSKHKRELARIMHKGLASVENDKRMHPTQKPAALAKWFFERWSKISNIVVDIYCGSGTTIIACEQLGRKCRAIEISPAYVAVALQRWADATGKTPKLVA